MLGFMRTPTEILDSTRGVDLIPAAELERSTTAFPGEWVDLIWKARAAFAADGLSARIRIGLNLNWFPAYDPDPEQCGDFGQLIHEADYIAPSFYGNWSNTDDGIQQVHDRRDEVDQISGAGDFALVGVSLVEILGAQALHF